ncbi:MAG TPA: signal peptidase I [Burkholderiales bacterium]|jgi:signal peptidase I|nr:signal peptidase I [Burkholderiales bacterium]
MEGGTLDSLGLNFALILFILTVFTGFFWFADVFYFKKRRQAAFDAEVRALDARIAASPEAFKPGDRDAEIERLDQKTRTAPGWLEFPASFFPVIAVVFGLRSFVVEPFKIPSGSMIPTLLIGDFILVNKFSYGIRLPVINKKIIEVGHPKRGDVMVFRYPVEPNYDYIKRVIGIPGDKISYRNKRLTINGVAVPTVATSDYLHKERAAYSKQFIETLDGRPHKMLNDDERDLLINPIVRFPYFENCLYNTAGVECTVPQGYYFMMGDNRDNSLDSRFWGFVPDENIVGRAFGIWMSWNGGPELSRIGGFD